MFRDGYSGGIIRTACINKDGVERTTSKVDEIEFIDLRKDI